MFSISQAIYRNQHGPNERRPVMRASVLDAKRLVLQADTAAELTAGNPSSGCDGASLREALALLIDKGYSAAPVIDEAGRAVGVLSRSDLLVHDRESAEHLREAPEYYNRKDLQMGGEA